jgi:hypothetical protein
MNFLFPCQHFGGNFLFIVSNIIFFHSVFSVPEKRSANEWLPLDSDIVLQILYCRICIFIVVYFSVLCNAFF